MAKQRVPATRRMWLPAAGLALFAAVIAGRLVQVQVLEHDRYAAQAKAELRGSATLYAQRGSILDRNGNVLAASVDTWDVYVTTRSWRDADVGQPASEILAQYLSSDVFALREEVVNSDLVDVIVARDVPYETGRAIMEESIPGVILLPNTQRIHPEGDIGSGLVGITGQDNTGLSGLEASLNSVLEGTPGRAIFERDTSGEPIPFGQYVATDPIAGKDVVLTIDRYLQRMAEQTLAEAVEEHQATGGSIVILDPRTGELLALATLPSIQYSTLDLDDEDATALLRNRAVTDLYEPGSVMKVVTAAAAIDAGLVSPHTTYTDTGVIDIYGTLIRNWDYTVYGEQTMTGVLQHSINTGAVYMAQMLGAERFQEYLDAFGFGQTTGIELQGEAGGIFRRPDDDAWSPVDLATQSFGQAILVTPVQMAAAVAATINGGLLVEPHLIKAYVDDDGKRVEVTPNVVSRPISEETSDAVRQMMTDVIYPGWDHPAAPQRYLAGGKSGTANVPIPNGEYTEQQVASFIGFAPANDPQILVLVKLDNNADLQTGTQAAGPVFADVIDSSLRYLNVPPTEQPNYAGAPR